MVVHYANTDGCARRWIFKILRVRVYTYQSTRKDTHVGPFVFYRRRLASAAANACMNEMRAHFATRRLERTVASVSFDIVRVVHLIHSRTHSRRTEFARASIMKVARTKAQLKHLKTKRKKAKEKRRRRRAREDATGGVMSMLVDEGGGKATFDSLRKYKARKQKIVRAPKTAMRSLY